MSANLIPITTDGGLITAGNITISTTTLPPASPAPSINGFSSATFTDVVNVPNLSFNSNVYNVGGFTISTLADIGGQVDYNNHTVGYVADNNGSSSLYARDSAGLGDNNAVVTANATNGTVTILAANTAGPNKTWTFNGAGNLVVPGSINGAANYNQPAFIVPNGSDSNWSYGIYTDSGSNFWMQSQFYGQNQTTRGFRVLESEGNAVVFSVNGAGDATVAGNITADNIGNISAINLTGSSSNVLYGNGVFAAPSGGSYGDSNVATFLSSFGSNTISTTGNVTTGNVVFGANTGQVEFHTGAYITGNANSISRDGSILLSPYTGAGSTFPGVVIGGAGRLIAPNGSVSQIFNASDVTFQVATKVTVGTASTTTTNGALVITGGAGISGNLNVGGNISGGNIIGNGSTLSNVATKTTGTWSLASGVNTVSISVPLNGTYSIWVNGNIPNGIITYTATAVITNNNVPVLGEQFAWYYAAGNALVLTSLPDQFVGTAGSISTATPYGGTTANVFVFGVTNNSGTTQIVNWGYTKL
jgi:hypothetical protein